MCDNQTAEDPSGAELFVERIKLETETNTSRTTWTPLMLTMFLATLVFSKIKKRLNKVSSKKY